MKMDFYVYDWNIDDLYGKEDLTIRMFGLSKDEKNVCINIRDFCPYFYIELPTTTTAQVVNSETGLLEKIDKNIKWSKSQIQLVYKTLQDKIFNGKCEYYEVKNRKKLYYSHKDSKMNDIYFPYLKCYFKTNASFFKYKYSLNKSIYVSSVGNIRFSPQEYSVSPILQLCCERDLPMSGWIKIENSTEIKTEKETVGDIEYECSYIELIPNTEIQFTPNPTILSFDIEVYSPNPNKFPTPDKPENVIFQISMIFKNNKKGKTPSTKYLLSIGEMDSDIVSSGEDNVSVISYPDEGKLLLGFYNIINKHNPHIITGWNILNFDIDYIIKRSQLLYIDEYLYCGFIKDKKCKVVDKSWSSSAYGKQSFTYCEWDGKVIIDLLVYARQTIKSENYKLETIASKYVKSHKDPLSHQDIFDGYRRGVLEKKHYGDSGKIALSTVAKYCLKDSILVMKLFEEFDMWLGITEMSAVCNVPMSYIYTQGQQIKVFSQVYKYCFDNKIVVEKGVYKCKDNEMYQGAYVKQPEPGIYNYVVPMDFASLYPTLIVAYNIDYSTFVTDKKIPDSMCNVIEWSEEHEYDIHPCKNCNKWTRGERSSIRNKFVGKGFSTKFSCEYCEYEMIRDYSDIIKYDDVIIKKEKINPPTKILEDNYRYRFLKGDENRGVLPSIITHLLDTRKKVRKRIGVLKNELKSLKKEDEEYLHKSNLISILNNRQLSYKVSANSMYGALGVKRGMLPLMPGAMCVTSMGRKSLHRAAEYLVEKYGINWVYSDTDSTYIQFPDLPPEKIWDRALEIEKEMVENEIFPKPMKLEFEECIYDPFFILTKKRYMWRYYKKEKDGNRTTEIGNKGVVLARRGTSKFLKDIYEKVVSKILDKESKENVLLYITEYINTCCRGDLPITDFIITKKLGDTGEYKVETAHVELMKLIQKRGGRVEEGERLEYVVCKKKDNGKVLGNAEDLTYRDKYREYIKLDYLYYIHLIKEQIDELLSVSFKIPDFLDNQYKLRKLREQINKQIREIFKPRIIFD